MNAKTITPLAINSDQKLYVIQSGNSYRSVKFQAAENLCRQIAQLLHRNELMPSAGVTGTPAGYQLYLAAIKQWSESPLSNQTFFEFGTDPTVKKVIENLMHKDEMIRLMVGDPETGVDSCSEFEVVGFVGRSCGSMKVPLISEPGENFGGPISTSRVLRILRVRDGKELYRHPKYQTPNVSVKPEIYEKDRSYTWAGFHNGELVARFKKPYDAAEWAEFITGALPCKREHLQVPLRRAA